MLGAPRCCACSCRDDETDEPSPIVADEGSIEMEDSEVRAAIAADLGDAAADALEESVERYVREFEIPPRFQEREGEPDSDAESNYGALWASEDDDDSEEGDSDEEDGGESSDDEVEWGDISGEKGPRYETAYAKSMHVIVWCFG